MEDLRVDVGAWKREMEMWPDNVVLHTNSKLAEWLTSGPRPRQRVGKLYLRYLVGRYHFTVEWDIYPDPDKVVS
jgi:hypothetical protein